MRMMSRVVLVGSLALIAVGAIAMSGVSKREEINHGKYLVEQVAMCVDCHSPRNEKGEFVTERWLGGAPLDFRPVHPMPWAEQAPPLAGMPGWEEDEMVKLLQTGATPSGDPLRPPMPAYRMTEADARAVTAYLRSLKPVALTTDD